MKPLAQAGRFEYNEPYKWKNFFSDREGGSEIFNEFVRGLKISEIKKFFFPLILYTQEPKSPKERNFSLENESFTAPYQCMLNITIITFVVMLSFNNPLWEKENK